MKTEIHKKLLLTRRKAHKKEKEHRKKINGYSQILQTAKVTQGKLPPPDLGQAIRQSFSHEQLTCSLSVHTKVEA